MSIVSCVQQLTSAISSYIAGLIVTKGTTGHLDNYNIVGYMAIATSLVAIYLSKKIYSVETTPTTAQVPSEVH